MAQKVAGQKRTDAESIVIFMTDGLPTCLLYTSEYIKINISFGVATKTSLDEDINKVDVYKRQEQGFKYHLNIHSQC